MNKLYEQIIFKNDSAPAINEDNLNAMSKAISDIDDRVITGYAAVVEAALDVTEIKTIAAAVKVDQQTASAAATTATSASETATSKASEAAASAQEAASTVSDLSEQFQDCIDKIDEIIGGE